MKKTIICIFTLWFAGHAHAFDTDKLHIHGFASQGYLKSSDNDFWFTETEDGTFQFNEFGINMSLDATENLRLGVQILSRDLGDVGNNEVEVDWAYGDYYFRNWLGIRAGILKRPHGLYNQIRDVDAARTWIFLPTSVYPEIYRAWFLRTQGIGIYGALPGDLFYEIQYGSLPVDVDIGAVKVAERLFNTTARSLDTTDVIALGIRWNTPIPGLLIGASGFSLGNFTLKTDIGDINTTRYNIYVASIEYEFEGLTFSAEYMRTVANVNLNENTTLLDNRVSEAYYGSAAYRFTDWFELGLGYSVNYPDKDDRDGDQYKLRGQPAGLAWLKDLFLCTRFDINENWLFKLEVHYMNGLLGVDLKPGDEPSNDWFLFATKVTFSF